jgi:hypothetical protein
MYQLGSCAKQLSIPTVTGGDGKVTGFGFVLADARY